MKLSIITVNLNNREGLKKTIDSVVTQTYKDFEWIIIDGGSTDGSKELIEEYSEYVSYWVSEPDNGIYSGMNKGICASSGEYLLFLNSGDCLYDFHVLKRIASQLNGADLYTGKELRDTGFLLDPKVEETEALCEYMLKYHIPHQSTVIRSNLFDKYGPYDEEMKIASDWCFFFQTIIVEGVSVKKLPFIVSVFDTKGKSATHIALGSREKSVFLSKMPRLNYLVDFYRNNYDYVKALNHSRIVVLFFRIYFFFYRKKNCQV